MKFQKGIGEPPNRPSGRRRPCAVQAFSPQVKTLAQGRLCRPRAFQSPKGGGRLWRPKPKKKDICFQQMSFFLAKHYNPDISNFRFAILIFCPTALLGRAAFAAYERFAAGKTSAEGWLCHPEHLNHRRAERALGPRSPKRKTRYKRVFLFGGGGESRTPVRKPFHGNFSGRRRLLRESCSPRSRHLRQAVTPEGQVSFMIHGRRKALPAHVHH